MAVVVLSYFKPNVMFFHRRLLIRASLFLNFCVLTYVALQAAQSTGGRTVESFINNSNQPQQIYSAATGSAETESAIAGSAPSTNVGLSSSLPSTDMETEMQSSSTMSEQQGQLVGTAIGSSLSAESSSAEQQDPSQSNSLLMATATDPPAPLDIDCQERDRRFSYSQRGSYWILNHYIPSDKKYLCNESVTYTTHGDVTFLDNIVPLAKRWDGPLSVSVYTPGSDYDMAIRSIAYLRQCTEGDVKEKVSFHFVLDERHFPPSLRKLHPQQGPLLTKSDALSRSALGEASVGGRSASSTTSASPDGLKRVVMVRSANGQTVIRVERSDEDSNRQRMELHDQQLAALAHPETDDLGLPIIDCEKPAPWSTPPQKTYKQIKNLTYPVNVLRNVARLNAPTHYVLASDAELYPSPDMIRLFLEMLRRNESVLHLGRPKVFVLPIFEVYGNQTVPTTKEELVEKLKSGLAVPFHQKVCSYCHSVPKSKEWLLANVTDGLHVFHIAKRHKPYQRWEPIYIGTQDDPLYDERLTWEGKSDKMTQGYALCMLDYDFMILDNAFLVHRPGVKVPRREPLRDAMAKKQSAVIRSAIYRELKVLYGQNSNCIL